ncbi:MAG: hypothetical protein ABSH32_09670 [Bryobacteraceae bacterium]
MPHKSKTVRRYPIQQDVCYRCFKGSRVSDKGVGKTVMMTNREVKFTTERALKPGQEIELAVNWPVLLGKRCLMKLVISGPVISSDARSAVVGILRYEFRTRAKKPELSLPLQQSAG